MIWAFHPWRSFFVKGQSSKVPAVTRRTDQTFENLGRKMFWQKYLYTSQNLVAVHILVLKHVKQQERWTKSFKCRCNFSFSELNIWTGTLLSHRTCLIENSYAQPLSLFFHDFQVEVIRYYTFSLNLPYHTNVCE